MSKTQWWQVQNELPAKMRLRIFTPSARQAAAQEIESHRFDDYDGGDDYEDGEWDSDDDFDEEDDFDWEDDENEAIVPITLAFDWPKPDDYEMADLEARLDHAAELGLDPSEYADEAWKYRDNDD